jgi:hypothetical protein
MNSSDQPLEAARALLEPGEVLLWADRPEAAALVRSKRQHFLRGALGLVVIAGFFLLSFLPNWPEGAKGVLLGGFVVLAVAYCLWLLAAPKLAQTAAGRMVYAVTDRRAMILETWPRRRLRVFRPADLDEPQVLPADTGLGSVVFVHRKLPWWERSAGGGYRTEVFYGIAEPERVGAALEALRSGAPPSTRLPDEDA